MLMPFWLKWELAIFKMTGRAFVLSLLAFNAFFAIQGCGGDGDDGATTVKPTTAASSPATPAPTAAATTSAAAVDETTAAPDETTAAPPPVTPAPTAPADPTGTAYGYGYGY